MINQEFIAELKIIRQKLIHCIVYFTIFFIIGCYYANTLFSIAAAPLTKYLPAQYGLITTNITTPLVVPLQLAALISFMLTVPFIYYNLYKFIAPGLYKYEKVIILPILFISIICFGLGVLFAYYISLPMMFYVFHSWIPPGVTFMADIGNYLNFVVSILFIFAVIFQTPIVIWLICYWRLVELSTLSGKRSYIFLITLIIGMLATPPDVISMLIVALPLYALFEFGLILVRFQQRMPAYGGVKK